MSRTWIHVASSLRGRQFLHRCTAKGQPGAMGHILHDWNLEEKRLLIRHAWEALPEGGAFIVYNATSDGESPATPRFDDATTMWPWGSSSAECAFGTVAYDFTRPVARSTRATPSDEDANRM